jgi:hypothetical protein
MRFSVILSGFAVATSSLVVAEPIPKDLPTKVSRDLATVSSVVAGVSAAITKLDTSVKAFSGDATQITADSAALITTLKTGATTIQGSTALSLTEALGLQSSVTTLQTAADGLVTDLGAKKAAFQTAKLCTTVATTVQDVQTSSNTLITGVVSKVPAAGQGIANNLVGGLKDTLSKGVALFANGACVDAA